MTEAAERQVAAGAAAMRRACIQRHLPSAGMTRLHIHASARFFGGTWQ